MKAYSYSEARKRFAEVLDTAKTEEVLIKRRGGEVFSLVYKNDTKSPFDVSGTKTNMTTDDILTAIKDSRIRTVPKTLF
jgi:prevent-host-death family protein